MEYMQEIHLIYMLRHVEKGKSSYALSKEEKEAIYIGNE